MSSVGWVCPNNHRKWIDNSQNQSRTLGTLNGDVFTYCCEYWKTTENDRLESLSTNLWLTKRTEIKSLLVSTCKRNQTTTGWAISSQTLSLHESSYLLNKSTALAQWCQKYEYLQKMQGHLAKEVKYGSASEAPTQCAAMRYVGIFDIFYLPCHNLRQKNKK